MIENLTIYLPSNKPDLKTVFPKGNANGGLFRPTTEFKIPTDSGSVQLGYMKSSELSAHLEGFQGYVMQLGNQTPEKWKAIARILETKTVLGVTLPEPISDDSNLFRQLKRVADENGGFIFVHDSILIEDGYLVGPASIDESDPNRQEMVSIREKNLTTLRAAGFLPATSLPISDSCELRPAQEIHDRLSALNALFTYVQTTEEQVAEDVLRKVVSSENLIQYFSQEEVEIWATPRKQANEKFINSIGWKTENIWPLAWILGFDKKPDVLSGMLTGEQIDGLLEFIQSDEAQSAKALQSVESIRELEDLFYCAHNAVRSAQLGTGEPTVPTGFDPMLHGGLVHERRHALSWALSPDRDWDDTDLST